MNRTRLATVARVSIQVKGSTLATGSTIENVPDINILKHLIWMLVRDLWKSLQWLISSLL